MNAPYKDEQALLNGLFAFLDQSVSPFHAAAAAGRLLEEAGYTLCPEGQPWHLEAGGRYYTTRNGSAVLAWRMPRGRLAGWHVTASHSDSPTWRIKVADIAEGGYLKAETEGGVEARLVAPDRALLCIPNVCIHFDREANTGKAWNYQVDLQPICGLEGGARLMEILAAEAGVQAGDILAHDLMLCTRQKAERVGVNGELFMSGRIDDLECAYTTLQGFLAGEGAEEGRADVWCMFDNEEVGSSSRQGAQGTLMADVMARIEEALGVSRDESVRARTNSLLLSADNGHATHPNHPEKSDPRSPVKMGGGILLKYNASQTYTTSGLTAAAFQRICDKAGVQLQIFANRADVRGGSTLGNLLGHQIAIPMVDIGLAQLAMHSAVETASCADAVDMARACAVFYNTPIFQPADGVWSLGL